jgi:tetratricopeptide (TPR) repeat protein
MRRRIVLLALLLLLAGAVLGWLRYQRTGPPPARPADFETLDPLVQGLLEEELAHVSHWRRSASAWLRLGMAEEANALYGEAERCYEQSLHLRPGHAKTLHRLACVQERLGDLAEAADTMARAAEADPSEPVSWWRLAGWRIDLGQLEEAEAALEHARTLAEAEPAVAFARVRLALAKRAPEEAVRLLRDEGLLDGGHAPYARHLLAAALRQQGDLEGAARASVEADGRGPLLADPWTLEVQQFETGYAALRLRAGRDVQARRFAEAERRLAEILEHDPADVRSLDMLAICRLEQGDARGALELAQRVLALQPEHYEGTTVYVRALLAQSNVAPEVLREASERLARVQAARLDEPGGWRLRAMLASALREPVEELAALERAIALDPGAPELRLRAGYKAVELGRFDEALARFLELQREPSAPTEAWFGEVMARLRAGDLSGAREALERLSQRADADPQRLRTLQESLARAGG